MRKDRALINAIIESRKPLVEEVATRNCLKREEEENP